MDDKKINKITEAKKTLNDLGIIFKEFPNGQLQVGSVNYYATTGKWWDSLNEVKGYGGLDSFIEYIKDDSSSTIHKAEKEKILSISELSKEINQNAKNKGWWDEERTFGDIIALCHSELSEALEEHRNGHKPTEIYTMCKMDEIKAIGSGGCGVCKNCKLNKPEGIPIELADVVIRIMDYCEGEGIDLESAILEKHEYNKNRPYRHGGKVI